MSNTDDPPIALETLLSEKAESARCRECAAFDDMVEPLGDSLVLFGAGSLGSKVLACLRRHHMEPLAFADNNPSKWGTQVEGVALVSPENAASRFGRSAAFVVTISSPGHSYLQTRKQLARMGCSRVVPCLPLLWKYADFLLPHYSFDRPTRILAQSALVRQGFAILDDVASRRQYVANLRLRLLGDFEGDPVPRPHNQYFPSDLITLQCQEAFVDCGAFNGDTIRSLLRRQQAGCGRIWAFEPDPSSFGQLSAYVSGLADPVRSRIILSPCAVGAARSHVRFAASGAAGASLSTSGGTHVECVTLDQALHNEEPTFMKLDVEGAEMDALRGACETIRRAAPLIAVCVYHRVDDLWRIPLYLHSLHAGYRFFLRAHSYEGWELVLYAIPRHREPPSQG